MMATTTRILTIDEWREPGTELLAAGGSGIVVLTHYGHLQVEGCNTSVTRVCGAAISCKEDVLVCAVTMKKDVIVLRRTDEGKWDQIANHTMPKRVTDLCFSNTAEHVILADGFGDVYKLPVRGSIDVRNESDEQEQTLLLGHVSTITSVDISESLVATADRDSKLRISHLQLPFIIKSFCFGHQDFITCVRWVNEELLLSGDGDGTIRLWKGSSGQLLETVNVREKINKEDESSEEEDCIISSIVVEPTSRDIAVFAVYDKPLLFLVSGLSSSSVLVSDPVITEEDTAISGIAFDDLGVLFVSCITKEEIVKYTLSKSSSAVPSVKLEFAGVHCSAAKMTDSLSPSVWFPPPPTRFAWLSQQRKKEMVADWKGKKRRHSEI